MNFLLQISSGADPIRYRTLADVLGVFNLVLILLFFLCCIHQVIYIPIAMFFRKRSLPNPPAPNRYAVLICGRNEAQVIGYLIDSLMEQDYPRDLFSVFVAADNCTDDTAQIARAHGAVAYERHDLTHIGKGYAMDFLLSNIDRDYPDAFDAYLVFDADNLVKEDFISRINEVFSNGYDVVTGYRNIKNYADNWISAAHGIWFIKDSCFSNNARMKLGTCTSVEGTGFVFSRRIKEAQGGWPFHLLTEDFEFTSHYAVKGEIFGYCAEAQFYDEQPTAFSDSWKQRLRWAKGGLQVVRRYGLRLFRGMCHRRFLPNYDIFSIGMLYVLSALTLLVNVGSMLLSLGFRDVANVAYTVLSSLAQGYVLFFAYALIITLYQWNNIRCPWYKKLLYLFTYPIFMFTYLPIALIALVAPIRWKPIRHKRAQTLSAIGKKEDKIQGD